MLAGAIGAGPDARRESGEEGAEDSQCDGERDDAGRDRRAEMDGDRTAVAERSGAAFGAGSKLGSAVTSMVRVGPRAETRAVPKEFGVSSCWSHRKAEASPEELLERVWDELADPFTNAVAVTISRLRTKLGDPPLIETVSRSGYRIGG